jgi:hypothetical protein
MPSDITLYAQEMYKKGYGCALWIPEPQSNRTAYLSNGGVSVGDVGCITEDGGFDTLFNVLLPADHPVNCRVSDVLGLQPHVPDGFVPLTLSQEDLVETHNFHKNSSVITSGSAEARCMGAEVQGAESAYVLLLSNVHLY